MAEHVLDNPAWHALGGPDARFASVHGPLRRYHGAVAPFGATANADDRARLAEHLPRDAVAAFWTREKFETPAGLEWIGGGDVLQMVAENFRPVPVTIERRALGAADVPAMMALVELTQPGPFLPRTHEFGLYLGVFDGTRLIAMAGERMHPPGYTEVSAVCTHPDYRGRGLAKALISAIANPAVARGDTPMLNVRADNAGAIAVYETLGFARRWVMQVTVLKHAGADDSAVPSFLKHLHVPKT